MLATFRKSVPVKQQLCKYLCKFIKLLKISNCFYVFFSSVYLPICSSLLHVRVSFLLFLKDLRTVVNKSCGMGSCYAHDPGPRRSRAPPLSLIYQGLRSFDPPSFRDKALAPYKNQSPQARSCFCTSPMSVRCSFNLRMFKSYLFH